MSDISKLKPCPFCGGEVKMNKGKVAFDDFEVSCDSCGFSGPNFGALEEVPYPEEEAVNHWNTRAAPKVKPLVWEIQPSGGYGKGVCFGRGADDVRYAVIKRNDLGWVYMGEVYQGNGFHMDGLKKAQAAAQFDYERRILSSLE